jgi:hypothetical protein
MSASANSHSGQRIVIGRTPAGLPRTYRVRGPRGRSLIALAMLRKFFA